MSLELLFSIACVLIVFLTYLFFRKTKQLKQQQEQIQALEKINSSLENTSSSREQRLDVLLSTVSEVVLRVDAQGRVLGGNNPAIALFKLGKVAVFPQSLLMFYRDNEWVEAYLAAVELLPEQVDLPEMNIEGRVFLPRLASVSRDESILLCTEITAYTQLQRKQKSLLENLMHDLKTPLTSLLGYARSIETFADDEALRKEASTVIAQEAKHINDLVNSMLTLNQIESQTSDIHKTCDIQGVLQQVWQSLDYAMQKKHVELELTLNEQFASVCMLDVDCHRILMNVADNALRFAPQNSTIYCRVQETDGFVCISIQDEGSGISEKHIKRVTERFYRVDDVRSRDKAQGHGLGLAIVKETLERDGGSLCLDNIEAGGLIVQLKFVKV